VVARGILGVSPALDMSQRAVQQDEPVRAQVIPDAVKSVLMLVRKAAGKCFLGAGQDVMTN
jgi:hypothetical protein